VVREAFHNYAMSAGCTCFQLVDQSNAIIRGRMSLFSGDSIYIARSSEFQQVIFEPEVRYTLVNFVELIFHLSWSQPVSSWIIGEGFC